MHQDTKDLFLYFFFKEERAYLNTFNANEVVESHPFVSVWIPDNGILPSCSIHDRKLKVQNKKKEKHEIEQNEKIEYITGHV